MKTVTEIRQSFWDSHPEFQNEYRKSYKQGQYRADIRMSFVDYVDRLSKDGTITQALAYRATLG